MGKIFFSVLVFSFLLFGNLVQAEKNMGALPKLGQILATKDRPWTNDDLEKVLGGIMLKSSEADIAIFERLSIDAPIEGEILFSQALQLLSPKGKMAVLAISGKQVKKIAALINNNAFNKKLTIYGMNRKTNTIGQRHFDDREKITIALSEAALLELFGIARLDAFREHYAIRAPFVESIYGDMNSLYFMGGPKIIDIADTKNEIEQALKQIDLAKPFTQIITQSLLTQQYGDIADFIQNSQGKPHHVITFNIDYLDIGISKNFANDTYVDRIGKLSIGRSKVSLLGHLFLFTNMSLNYDAYYLLTSLTSEIKYMHTKLGDAHAKPEKDKVKLGLNFKLPWERTLLQQSSIVMSPILKNTFETELGAQHWFSDKKSPDRKKRMDSLLGMNFDFKKLGFNIDVGGMIAADFNQKNVNDGLDFGPGVNFSSKWALFGPLELSSKVKSYYLFSSSNNKLDNKVALAVEGTMWLRLARFYNVSVSAMSDFLVTTTQQDPDSFAISSIFGLTVSYGQLFRLLG